VRSRLLLIALISLTFIAAPAARAATFLATSVEDTARGADAVVRGKVEKRTSRWVGHRIMTDVEISVASAWKGQPGSRVTVTVPGGVVGDLAQRVDAAPVFTDGEEVVVFLARARRAAGWRVNGLALGKFRVAGREAAPGTGGARFETRRPLADGERLVGPMPVAELERRVRSAR
jgi:hypothetical protein